MPCEAPQAVPAMGLCMQRWAFTHSCKDAQVIQARKAYVPAYVRCLQNDHMGGDASTAQWDTELPECAILVFRRLAHAKVKTWHANISTLRARIPTGRTLCVQTACDRTVSWFAGWNAACSTPGPSTPLCTAKIPSQLLWQPICVDLQKDIQAPTA